MSSALAKAKETLSRVRTRGKIELNKRMHTATAVGTGFGVGYYEGSTGKHLPAPGKMDGKFFWGALCLAGAEFGVGGEKVTRVLQSNADGLLSISGYTIGHHMGTAAKKNGHKTGGVDDAEAFEAVLGDADGEAV